MHVLYLSAQGGGHETNVRVLVPALIGAGHRVSILYLHPSGEAQKDTRDKSGISIYHASYGDWHYYFNKATFGLTGLPLMLRSLESGRALVRKIREIHRHDPVDLVELSEVILPQRPPIPFVVRLHSQAWLWKRECHEPTSTSDLLEMRLEGSILMRAAAVTAPSSRVADQIRSMCRRPNLPIEIIPYPVDTAEFTPAERKEKRKSVLFVGRVEKRKGADVLLRAIPHVLEKHRECEFIFVGQKSDELANSVSGAPNSASFLSFKPRSELVELYQKASVCVVPSLWDNSPNVIYEAMSCGVPVIATRVGGIPELIDDGITGLLVPPGDEKSLADAINSLLDNPEMQIEMGQRGREKAVEDWAVDTIVERTLRIYERVIGTKRLSFSQRTIAARDFSFGSKLTDVE